MKFSGFGDKSPAMSTRCQRGECEGCTTIAICPSRPAATMAVPKPERNIPQRDYREKAREVCSKLTKLQGYCERCLRTDKTNIALHSAHVIPASYGNTDCDLENRVCLCALCHVAGNDSAHLHERDFHEWFDAKFPGRRERLQRKSRLIFKGDWSEVYEKLLERYKAALEEKLERENKTA